MLVEQILLQWEEYATIKHWKKQLARNSDSKQLSAKTWQTYQYWMKKFLKFTQQTPDYLIEEAQRDQEKGFDRLIEFEGWSINEKNMDKNVVINGTYGPLRSFYRHNNVNTLSWKTSQSVTRKIEQLDSNYPMFKRQEINGKRSLTNCLHIIKTPLSFCRSL